MHSLSTKEYNWSLINDNVAKNLMVWIPRGSLPIGRGDERAPRGECKLKKALA